MRGFCLCQSPKSGIPEIYFPHRSSRDVLSWAVILSKDKKVHFLVRLSASGWYARKPQDLGDFRGISCCPFKTSPPMLQQRISSQGYLIIGAVSHRECHDGLDVAPTPSGFLEFMDKKGQVHQTHTANSTSLLRVTPFN